MCRNGNYTYIVDARDRPLLFGGSRRHDENVPKIVDRGNTSGI